jgi:hypothetical protein
LRQYACLLHDWRALRWRYAPLLGRQFGVNGRIVRHFVAACKSLAPSSPILETFDLGIEKRGLYSVRFKNFLPDLEILKPLKPG